MKIKKKCRLVCKCTDLVNPLNWPVHCLQMNSNTILTQKIDLQLQLRTDVFFGFCTF